MQATIDRVDTDLAAMLLLAALDQTKEVDPYIRPLLPFRGASLAIQTLDAPEFIISGPSETGKTLGALYRLHTQAMQYPRSQWAIVRKVRNDMDGTVLQTWRRIIAGSGVTTFGGEKPSHYDYPKGARVWVGGMDRPGSTLSGERDGVYVNQAEELSLHDWETITTRTTGRAGNAPFGQTFGDCNPGPPHHWIKQRPEIKLLESRHEDNPMLFDYDGQITEQGKRTMAVLDALTGVRKERLRYGHWVQAEGAVYDFDEAIHLIDRFDIPMDGRRIRVIDFGYTNPFVCQWWYIDGDGRMFLYREIYMTKRTVKVHAEQIKALSGPEKYETTIADHDAEDRATLDENGIYTIAAHKAISVGIQKVQERLNVAGDGKPRLFVMRNALVERDGELSHHHKPTHTREEFGVYLWPKGADGKSIKEIPVDADNHGMDAMRYAVHYVDAGGFSLFVKDEDDE